MIHHRNQRIVMIKVGLVHQAQMFQIPCLSLKSLAVQNQLQNRWVR